MTGMAAFYGDSGGGVSSRREAASLAGTPIPRAATSTRIRLQSTLESMCIVGHGDFTAHEQLVARAAHAGKIDSRCAQGLGPLKGPSSMAAVTIMSESTGL